MQHWLEEVEKFAYEHERVKYVTFEVIKLKEPDKFGRTFTCYFSKKVNTANEAAPKKASAGKTKKAKSDELSFVKV